MQKRGKGDTAQPQERRSQAVFTENNEKVIYVATGEGKSAKRVVKTGGSDEGVIELLEGVSEGDRVLLKKPE